MNKKLLFVVVLVLMSTFVLSSCNTPKEQACLDLGGLISSEGCVLPKVECPACPACDENKTTVEQPQAPVEASTGWCTADIVGIPVEKDGSCTFCTINYLYDPKGVNAGDVYIVSATPMEYKIGAYVYQYKQEKFLECISAQPFMVDPGYRPVYK